MCVIGVEPNPNHQASLDEVVREFSEKGERLRFLVRTAISNEASYQSFSLGQRDTKVFQQLQTGATLFPRLQGITRPCFPRAGAKTLGWNHRNLQRDSAGLGATSAVDKATCDEKRARRDQAQCGGG